MATRVLILGAGFGGLELATTLSEELGEEVEVTLIDKGDAFVFGYSKLDVLFGRASAGGGPPPLRRLRQAGGAAAARDRGRDRPGGAPRDHRRRRPTRPTSSSSRSAPTTTWSDARARRGAATSSTRWPAPNGWRRLVQEFDAGRAIVGVCGAPFKCPPAPSEAALLLHDHLTAKGVRDDCEITFVAAAPQPGPPLAGDLRGAARGLRRARHRLRARQARIASLDTGRRVAVLDDGTELPYDLFLGVPKHRAPDVVIESGMTEDGYVPVDSRTLATSFPGVYAVGDVATVGVPKAGVFAEGAGEGAGRVADRRAARGGEAAGYRGPGLLLHRVRRRPGRQGRRRLPRRAETDRHLPRPLRRLVAEKQDFGASRAARWFGL